MEPTLTTPAPAPSQQAAPAASPTPAATPAVVNPAASSAAPANLVSGDPNALVIPDKFKVTREDGTIDYEATLAKSLGSYTYLEKKLGSGDVPPENETGYKLDYSAFPEGIKIDPESEKSFLKRMHGSGMTNKQVQAVLNEYGAVIKQGFDIQKTQETARVSTVLSEVATELKTAWGENNDANVKAATRGFHHLADETDKADKQKIGKDAKVTYRILMKVLAKVGAGITEDTQVLNAEGAGGMQETLAELRASKAYTDENDPQHNAVVAKAKALYEKMYPSK